jgi:hypothetical protein
VRITCAYIRLPAVAQQRASHTSLQTEGEQAMNMIHDDPVKSGFAHAHTVIEGFRVP